MKKRTILLLGLGILISATVCVYARAVGGNTVGGYHVYYDGGADGVYGLPSDDGDYAEGSVVTVTSGVPARDGGEFLGWRASIDGGTYAGGDTLTITDSDVVLYAIWEDIPAPEPESVKYTITYYFDGYSVTDEDRYEAGTSVTVKDLGEIKDDYAGANELSYWQYDSSTSYTPGQEIIINSDTVLTAVWKTVQPAINQVYEEDDVITGTGIPGAAITVSLPDGSRINCTADSAGIWLANVPAGVTLDAGQVVRATQQQTGMTVSDPAETTVIGVAHIETNIDMYVENLTTGADYAKAGDLLLYDLIVSNNGSASSNWESAYVTIYLDDSVTLQASSIRINSRAVTSSQYSYDSTANTLTLYLGDIAGGNGVNISFRAAVSSDIADIDDTVLYTELGSL